MQDIIQFWWVVPASLLVSYAVAAATGAFRVYKLGRTTVSPIDQAEATLMRTSVESDIDADWLAEQGFEPAGCFRMRTPGGAPEIVGWKHAKSSIFFCYYMMPSGQFYSDFVTIMADRSMVITGTQMDSLLLPPKPGSWVQVFLKKSLPDRWALHIEAETILTEATGIAPAVAIGTLDQEIAEAIANQIGYVRSLPLWPLRIPIWCVFRCIGLVNKTVASQMKR